MPMLLGGIPIEADGNVPVNLQDQSSRMVAALLHVDLNDGQLLSVQTTVGDLTVTLTAGHGAVAGNIVIIREGINWFFAGVLSVATNVLTLDTPLDAVFTTSADVTIADANLNKDGSTTTVEAHAIPPDGAVWDVTRLHVILIDDAAMDFTTFGGIGALTKGLVFGKSSDTAPQNIANVKTNGDLILFAVDHSFQDKVGGGEYSFAAQYQFGGQSGVGVTMRLNSLENDSIRLLIQDDLRAVSSIRFVAIGHVVED